MKDRTKKVIKYGIIGAIFAAIGLFIYRVWKRVKKSEWDAEKEGDQNTINMTPGENGVYDAEAPGANSKSKIIKTASIEEFNDWATKIKNATDNDWFTRLINFSFKRKK